MKQTTELIVAGAQTINAGVQAGADGKIDFQDLPAVFQLVPSWQLAIADLEVNTELRTATESEFEAAFVSFRANLPALSPDAAMDATNIVKGIFGGWRMIARINYERGLKEAATPSPSPLKGGEAEEQEHLNA